MSSLQDVDDVLLRLTSLRQHSQDGRRSPHEPLLVLLALGRLAQTGSSRLPWSEAETRLAALIGEFAPASRTAPAQSAAYPFTRLRSDGLRYRSSLRRCPDLDLLPEHAARVGG